MLVGNYLGIEMHGKVNENINISMEKVNHVRHQIGYYTVIMQ